MTTAPARIGFTAFNRVCSIGRPVIYDTARVITKSSNSTESDQSGPTPFLCGITKLEAGREKIEMVLRQDHHFRALCAMPRNHDAGAPAPASPGAGGGPDRCCAAPKTRAHALEQSPPAYAQYCVRGGPLGVSCGVPETRPVGETVRSASDRSKPP